MPTGKEAERPATGASESHVLSTAEDAHERKSASSAMEMMAKFDDLTGLPNRHTFITDLKTALTRAAQDGRSVGLIVIDVHEFKQVNDVFGYEAGDLLLTNFAARVLETELTVYGLGGDEFAVIVEESPDSDRLIQIADELGAILTISFTIGDVVQECRVSIGCAIFPEHGTDVRELLKSADIALFEAKAAGRKQTKVFESEMRSQLQKRASMLCVARSAIDAHAVDAFFQPKVSLESGRIAGFEALLRLHHPRLGAQLPRTIEAAFEHPDIAVALADCVLAKVIAAIKNWGRNGVTFGRVAVNASPMEFRDGAYAERLLARLADAEISPQSIEVEVTENVFMEQEGSSIQRTLELLKKAGITVALDDFGTGYASLSHLHRYPVDVIKIDQSFVKNLVTQPRQALITKALIGLSRTMGIRTVAEGVQTRHQAKLLFDLGCDLAQGYLFGRAVSAQEAESLIRADKDVFRAAIMNEIHSLRPGSSVPDGSRGQLY